MAIDDTFAPGRTDGGGKSAPEPWQVLSDDGAITIASGAVFLTKATASAITIAAPPVAMDGALLSIISTTAAAHTVTFATVGFNDLGASGDVGTFGGAKGDGFTIRAYNGGWFVASNINVTIA